MLSCFNFAPCSGPFRVHIYPDPPLAPVSNPYSNILASIRSSKYYTAQASEACLFVLSYDTLDRDPASSDFVENLQSKLNSADPYLWNQGRNHLIFNMYHGTPPNYAPTDLGINIGMAMLAWASTHRSVYRDKFDIAWPLYHKNLSLRAEKNEMDVNFSTPYLLVFKGKRYLFGIGSETRNLLYRLHNGNDVIMVTTCKHRDWIKYQDQRCPHDNELYERWDYTSLMNNSAFCLVPRGRRLGTYRFLESLKLGCIPVVLSDDWLLPFSELIDWSVAAITIDERLILHVPELLGMVPQGRILAMKQEARRLYEMHFNSVENIVHTALEIIRSRLATPGSTPFTFLEQSQGQY